MGSAEQARYAAEAVYRAGIPIAEITMTVPGALEVIPELLESVPEMVVGAGTVLDLETAERSADAEAKFLTSTGFIREVVEFARRKGILVIPGALTPSEVIHAWKAGADFVKIFPCAPLGGDHYIRALKAPFPQIPFVAAGGVNQQTALNYILASASALGVGGDLIPTEALERKQEERIHELARRFLARVKGSPEPPGGALGILGQSPDSLPGVQFQRTCPGLLCFFRGQEPSSDQRSCERRPLCRLHARPLGQIRPRLDVSFLRALYPRSEVPQISAASRPLLRRLQEEGLKRLI